MGKIKTYLIDNQLIELLSGDYVLMGNGRFIYQTTEFDKKRNN